VGYVRSKIFRSKGFLVINAYKKKGVRRPNFKEAIKADRNVGGGQKTPNFFWHKNISGKAAHV